MDTKLKHKDLFHLGTYRSLVHNQVRWNSTNLVKRGLQEGENGLEMCLVVELEGRPLLSCLEKISTKLNVYFEFALIQYSTGRIWYRDPILSTVFVHNTF
jgi:hypothetical protein